MGMSSRDEDEVGSMCVETCLEEVSEQLRHRYPAVYERLRNERQESPGSIMAVGPMMFVPKPSCKGPMKKPVPHKNGAPATPDQPVETFSAMGRSPPASLADFAAKRT